MSKASRVREVQVRCMRCQEWVTHPVTVKDIESIDPNELHKHICQCPKCGDMASCNIKNIRVLDDKGKFVEIEG